VNSFAEICQPQLAVAPWTDALGARLPGLQPVAPGQWLLRDEAFAAQMAYRDLLIEQRLDDVAALRDNPTQAEVNLLTAILHDLKDEPGYRRRGKAIIRPDGEEIDVLGMRPLIAAARLVQEDMLILENSDRGYVLTSGVLCFPASWTLRQKVGRGMMGIHTPVERYDEAMGKRVDRILSSLQPGKAVWRANVLCYNDPHLFQPRLESEKRPFDPEKPLWVRVERQTLMRLSPADAIVFTIHTHVVPMSALTPEQVATLPDAVRRGGSMGDPLTAPK
jgi:dimethylamine monooxygenase subunit A